jgi:hypothetical protein
VIYQAPTYAGAALSGEFLSLIVKLLPLLGSTIAVTLAILAQQAFTLFHTKPYRALYRLLSYK